MPGPTPPSFKIESNVDNDKRTGTFWLEPTPVLKDGTSVEWKLNDGEPELLAAGEKFKTENLAVGDNTVTATFTPEKGEPITVSTVVNVPVGPLPPDEIEIKKRTQLERMINIEIALSQIWEEFQEGNIEDILQVSVYAQTFINRIVWKLNERNNHDKSRPT